MQDHATSGDWSYRFKAEAWSEGMPQWPAVTLVPTVSDWTGYDRLVVDIANLTLGCADKLSLYVANAEGRVQAGLHPTAINVRGFVQWVISLESWPKDCDPSQIMRVHFYTSTPGGFDLRIDRLTLLAPGEELPSVPSWALELTEAEQTYFEETYERGHDKAYAAFRAACQKAGCAQEGLLLGQVTSMENLLPRGLDVPRVIGSGGLSVRLAQNEREALQLIVAADGADLSEVCVTVSDLRHEREADCLFPAANIHVGVTGYTKVTDRPPYAIGRTLESDGEPGYLRKAEPSGGGWWPDAILDYTNTTSIAGTDFQSFWIRVSCPAACRAGIYRGTLTVTADGRSVGIPFAVRVNAFVLPSAAPLPMAVTFSPGVSTTHVTDAEELARLAAIKKDPNAPVNLWKSQADVWVDFLADYGLTMDNIYSRASSNFPNWARILHLREQGRLGPFNLGYWDYPADLSDETKAAWTAATVDRIRPAYERAVAEGLLNKAYVYGCDEIGVSLFANVNWAAGELKKAFPGLKVLTTSYDTSYGLDGTLSAPDGFVPKTSVYDPEHAALSRKAGHEVWWYICCSPHAPYANSFIESQAIELRMLMGAQTQKYKPDGFLYYQTSIWNSERVISGTNAFTDWTARSWSSYNGDGSFTRAGPEGIPLPTLRLENFRDGLEDLAYARLLEARLEASPSSSWADEARALLAVPSSIVATMANFSDDPARLYQWRDKMADLLEQSAVRTGVRVLFY